MQNHFRLEVRNEGDWEKIAIVKEECLDKTDPSILLDDWVIEDVLLYKKKRLRLYRILYDGDSTLGHEVAEFDRWEIIGNKLYAINPGKYFRHNKHIDRN